MLDTNQYFKQKKGYLRGQEPEYPLQGTLQFKKYESSLYFESYKRKNSFIASSEIAQIYETLKVQCLVLVCWNKKTQDPVHEFSNLVLT